MTGAPRSSGRVVAAPEAAQKAATMDVSSRAGTPPDNWAAGVRAPAAVFSRVISVRRCQHCHGDFIRRSDRYAMTTCEGCRTRQVERSRASAARDKLHTRNRRA
jgi:hypothetical protein